MNNQKNTLTIIAHSIILIIIWVSAFFVPWYVIAIGIAAYYIQLMTIGDCILTRVQFQTTKRETTFYTFIFNKLGLHPNPRRMVLISDYVLPWIALAIAIAKDIITS